MELVDVNLDYRSLLASDHSGGRTLSPDFINQIPDRARPLDGADGQAGRPGAGCAGRSRELAEDKHLLADIGLTREQALDEAAKPFWR